MKDSRQTVHVGCAASTSSATSGGSDASRNQKSPRRMMYSSAHARSARGSLGPAPESTPPLKDGASAAASFPLVMVFWDALSATRWKCCGIETISDCTFGRGWWCEHTRTRDSKASLFTWGSSLMAARNSVAACPSPFSYPRWPIRCLATMCAARTNRASVWRGINKPGSCQMKSLSNWATYAMLLGMRSRCGDRDSGSDLMMNEV